MLFTEKKRLKEIRESWGREKERFRNMELISSYFNMRREEPDSSFVDDKTWEDLDLDSLYAIMDRTRTGPGRQYLYYCLRRYAEGNEELKQKFDLINMFGANRETREKIELRLSGLSGISSFFIPVLLFDKNLPYSKFYPVFYFFTLASILSLFLISVNGIFLFVSLGMMILNLVINKTFSGKIYEYFTGFSGLNSLIITSLSLGKLRVEEKIGALDKLKEKRKTLSSLKKKLGYLVVDKESLNELAALVIEYLNMFFLFDIIAYYRSVNTLMKHREDIHEVFECVAELDTLISAASFLKNRPDHCAPRFTADNWINIGEMYHPMIEEAVPNSLNNLEFSMLITGSNMSGKTTFIKTLGVNFILARTFGFALAEKFEIPPLEVKSSIRRNEDLEEGKSYFFVEIEALKEFMILSERKGKYLFLIDEIFRGTNTVERLASSTAVLKYLDRNNFIFVTTHDIELQELLKGRFEMFHFSEQVEDEKFFFNYNIQPGPCRSGNAIKLLEIMDYPEEVTKEAKDLAGDIGG